MRTTLPVALPSCLPLSIAPQTRPLFQDLLAPKEAVNHNPDSTQPVSSTDRHVVSGVRGWGVNHLLGPTSRYPRMTALMCCAVDVAKVDS